MAAHVQQCLSLAVLALSEKKRKETTFKFLIEGQGCALYSNEYGKLITSWRLKVIFRGNFIVYFFFSDLC